MDLNTFFALVSEIVAKIIKMFTQTEDWLNNKLPEMTTVEDTTV